jgi:signal transduction histidine kinase
MSHELRTPLNAIGGHVQLLELGLHGAVSDAQQGALARVQRAQRHLLHVINEILNYARLEAARSSTTCSRRPSPTWCATWCR